MGLSDSEFSLFCDLMGREPSLTEVGMVSVMWSEHCGYKFSRPVLSYFSEYKKAMEGEGLENAGVVPIGDGLGVVLKVESHNHPSAVEPYQGAATGVGGILRDIFTMGARPVAMLNSLRFGPIKDGEERPEVVARNRYLFEHVVAGIAGYGNCVGVPTVAGEVNFHPRYSGNPLVNAMCVGIVPVDAITTAGAAGTGNPVIYLGSATGKDGIHGATFASDVLGEDSEEKRPNVQIGDPFAEKLLIEATLEALQTGAIVAIQDMGAAGLTCSITEMSAKGGVGMEIDLDKVPVREADMTGYEIMLSESQERMLCVAHAGREGEVISIFRKWGVHAEVIGTVTDSGRVRIRRWGQLEVDADAAIFTDHCPTYRQPLAEPEYAREAAQWTPDALPATDLTQGVLAVLGHSDVASKEWVYRQFDQQVMTQTTLVPGRGDAAVLAPRGTVRGLSMKLDGNSRWTYFDPLAGGMLAVVEACRNVACTGARPVGLTDGLNFGSPQEPHVFWQFERAVRGIADAADALGAPVVSGNVSFYNQSELGEVLPTPMIGAVGLLEDASRRVGAAPGQDADLVLVRPRSFRETRHEGLGASLFTQVNGVDSGRPEMPDLAAEKALCQWLPERVLAGEVLAAHDVSDGGLAVTLAEIALIGGRGVEANLSSETARGLSRPESVLFGEFPGWVVVSVAPGGAEALLADLPEALSGERIGSVTEGVDGLQLMISAFGESVSVDAATLRKTYESGLWGS